MEPAAPPLPNPPTAFAGPAKDELNLAEFPISLLDNRHRGGELVLTFGDTIRDPKTGHPIERKLTVSASAAHGLPTALDDEVLLGLIQLSKAQRFADRKVHFTRHQLITLLRWPNNGSSYHRVEESLNRWKGVDLTYKNAWWDPASGRWVTDALRIIDNYQLFEESSRDGPGLPFSWFMWNEMVFRSFQAGYMRTIDLNFFLGLRTPIAKRLYRFLGKRFYHGRRWEFALTELAFEHVGLSRTYHNGVIKQKLSAAVDELVQKGFLADLPPAERYVKRRRGEWTAVFVAADPAAAAGPAPAPAGGLVDRLVARGVTAGTAAELAARHPAERIEAQLDALDFLLAGGADAGGVKNPAGFLVKAIADDYAPPAGYVPKAEREKKRAAAAAVKVVRDKEAADRRAEEARFTATRKHVERYLAALPDADRAALEERALAAADDWQRECVRQGRPGSAGVRHGLVEAEVLRVCPLP